MAMVIVTAMTTMAVAFPMMMKSVMPTAVWTLEETTMLTKADLTAMMGTASRCDA
jgi:hypothetical protein